MPPNKLLAIKIKPPLIFLALALSTSAVFAESNLVGRRVWIVGVAAAQIGVEVAQSPSEFRNTTKLKSGSLVLGKKARNPSQFFDREVRLADGRKGFIGPASFQFFSFVDPAKAGRDAIAECERRGPPKIGMTPVELVETCWRRPARIVKKTTESGIEESYVYGIGIVKVTDGKVSEIVEAR